MERRVQLLLPAGFDLRERRARRRRFPDGLADQGLADVGAGSLSYPAGSSVATSQPIGLDGLYRKGSPKLSDPGVGHITAAKGTWLNAQTFVIDAPNVGYGEQQKVILTFSGKKLNLRRTVAVGEGWDASVDGEQGD